MEEEKEKKIEQKNEMRDEKDNNEDTLLFARFGFQRIKDNFRKQNGMILIFFLHTPLLALSVTAC
jgi:hypothetical protein